MSTSSSSNDGVAIVGKQQQQAAASSSVAISTAGGVVVSSPSNKQQPLHWKILFTGQVLSFLLASAGAAMASLHLECNVSVPNFSNGIMYLILSFHIIPIYLTARKIRSSQQTNKKEEKDDSDTPNNKVVDDKQKGKDDDEKFNDEEEIGDSSSSSSTIKPSSVVPAPRYSLFNNSRIPLHAPAWKYFLISILDVEGNFMMVLAFRDTTLTSAVLFGALAVPSAMILSYIFLKRKYVPIHIIGVIICLIGVLLNVFSDVKSNLEAAEDIQNKDDLQNTVMSVELSQNVTDEEEYDNGSDEYPNKVAGDIHAIIGAICFGASDFLMEYSVRNYGGPIEFNGMVGLFGSIISFIQAIILERDDIKLLFTSQSGKEINLVEEQQVDDPEGPIVGDVDTCTIMIGILLVVAYVMATSIRYVTTSYFLLYSEAALLNLSLLTSDIWSVIFSIAFEHIVPEPMFYGSAVLLITGVIVYETAPSPIVNGNTSNSSSKKLVVKQPSDAQISAMC